MRSMIRSYYNVYENDKLIADTVISARVCDATGMKNPSHIPKYAEEGWLYKGIYRIEKVKEVKEEKKVKPLVREPEQNSAFTPTLVEEWNNVMKLFHPEKETQEV